MLQRSQDIGAVLEKLGLTKNESRVYLAALELGTASIQTIAKRVRMHRVLLYPIVQSLLERGLLATEPRKYGRRFTAVTPRRLVGMAVDAQEQYKKIADRLEATMPELLALYKTEHRPRVRFLEGVDGYKELMHEITETRQPYMHIGASEKPLTDMVGSAVVEKMIAERDTLGMHRRVIATREPWTLKQVKTPSSQGLRDYRFLPHGIEIPTRCYLYGGNRVAFISFEPEVIIVIVEDENIFKLQKLFFDTLWEKCETS